jgi:hypothetical protein
MNCLRSLGALFSIPRLLLYICKAGPGFWITFWIRQELRNVLNTLRAEPPLALLAGNVLKICRIACWNVVDTVRCPYGMALLLTVVIQRLYFKDGVNLLPIYWKRTSNYIMLTNSCKDRKLLNRAIKCTNRHNDRIYGHLKNIELIDPLQAIPKWSTKQSLFLHENSFKFSRKKNHIPAYSNSNWRHDILMY